jgi:iron complex outermembrane receptor protein
MTQRSKQYPSTENGLSWLCGGLLLSACFLVPVVHAEDEDLMLEEVVVEAQKKLETVTDTPIAILAVTGEQFLKQANFTFQDIARASPGLSFETGVTPSIHMRGIGSITRAAASLRTNIYQDGVLLEDARPVFDAMFDIERFEILRGPQGTLYGKSSPTGTINIRTKDPNTSEMDGYVAGTLASRNTVNTQFGVSVPIIRDELAVRVAGVFDENSSSGTENTSLDLESRARSKGVRLVGYYQPVDQFSARLGVTYHEMKDNPWYVQDGGGFDVEDLELTNSLSERNDAYSSIASLELTYDIADNLALISVSSYQNNKFINRQDADGGLAAVAETQDTVVSLEPLAAEDLRLESSDNEFWDWQLGFFYQRNDSRVTVNYDVGTLASIYIVPQFHREENAIYTHNTIKFTPDTNLIFGLRYQHARSKSSQPTSISSVLGDSAVNAIPEDLRNQDFYASTGTIKLQHYLESGIMTYVSFDRAYRAGGVNVDVRSNLPSDFAAFDEETANSIELGMKGNFWDRRGRFALAIYDQIYKNFQQDVVNLTVWDPVRVPTPGPNNLTSLEASAKEAETRGIESDTTLLLTEAWTLSLSAAFNDAKFNDFKDNPCNGDISLLSPTRPYNTCDVSGDRLPQAPRWSGSLSSDYWMPVVGDMQWYISSLLNAKSSQIDEVTRDTLPGYATLDIFSGFRSGEETGWDVSLWIKNAFDRVVVTRVYRAEGSPLSAPGFLPYDQVFTNMPRQFGVTGTLRF